MLGLAPQFDRERFAVETFPEVASGVLKPAAIALDAGHGERLDVAVAQQSAVGMRTPEVAPGAPIELQGLHPRLDSWSFVVPAETPRMAIENPARGSHRARPEDPHRAPRAGARPALFDLGG